jgi:hypothetical protein
VAVVADGLMLEREPDHASDADEKTLRREITGTSFTGGSFERAARANRDGPVARWPAAALPESGSRLAEASHISGFTESDNDDDADHSRRLFWRESTVYRANERTLL